MEYGKGDITIPLTYIQQDEILQILLVEEFYSGIEPEKSFSEIEEQLYELESLEREAPYGIATIYLLKGLLVLESEFTDGTFPKIESYCIENNIPFDRHTPQDDFEQSSAYVQFYRPGFEKGPISTLVDSVLSPHIPANLLMDMINNSPEEETDTEIMLKISEYVESLRYTSGELAIENWVENV